MDVEFCREMDGDNHNATCFSLASFVLLSAALNRHQASRQVFRENEHIGQLSSTAHLNSLGSVHS